jgi:hypothetical protein
VATLCNLDVLTGNLSNAKVHMTGLEQIVRMRHRQTTGELQRCTKKIVSW